MDIWLVHLRSEANEDYYIGFKSEPSKEDIEKTYTEMYGDTEEWEYIYSHTVRKLTVI